MKILSILKYIATSLHSLSSYQPVLLVQVTACSDSGVYASKKDRSFFLFGCTSKRAMNSIFHVCIHAALGNGIVVS